LPEFPTPQKRLLFKQKVMKRDTDMATDYTHVLAAIDFAHESVAVIGRAGEIARRYQARLTLLNVVEDSALYYQLDDPLVFDQALLNKELVAQAEQQMAEARATIDSVEAASRVEIGIPKHEIVRVADELNADLIVIGSHGRHGLQMLLGSTANGVLHQARCDVLAVRIAD
jgi:universal stress protein A